MLRADNAKVEWDKQKKCWEVYIQIGAEVIRRPIPKHTPKSGDSEAEALRSLAMAIGREEGYDLYPAQIAVIQDR